jgi:hypothetical protein
LDRISGVPPKQDAPAPPATPSLQARLASSEGDGSAKRGEDEGEKKRNKRSRRGRQSHSAR